MIYHEQKYSKNGVYVTPSVLGVGDKVRISYDGILAKSGAADIWARVGYGDTWENSYDLEMSKGKDGFESTFSVANAAPINICFKDSADHWDNNLGQNYTFDVVQ